MHAVARSLVFALAQSIHPSMLWLMLWPWLIAAAIWGAVALVFWGQFVIWLTDLLLAWIRYGGFGMSWDATDVARVAAKIVALFALVPLVQLTTLLILGVFCMPAMLDHVTQRSYPRLACRRGGSLAGSVWNSLVALAGLVALAVLSLPFWVFPPLWPVIPVALAGWFNQRILRYDALASHADAAEMRTLFRERRAALFGLGALLALLAYIPPIGLVAPVLFGLAFVHYLLGALAELREAPIGGEPRA